MVPFSILLGTPVLLETIFSSFTNVQLALLFHGLVKNDHLDGLKTIQQSFNCHFWKQRLKRMEKSYPILRYLNPPDDYSFQLLTTRRRVTRLG